MHPLALLLLLAAPADDGASCDDIRRVRASLVREGLDDGAVAALESRRCAAAPPAMSSECLSLSIMTMLASMDGSAGDDTLRAVDGFRAAVCALEAPNLASSTTWPNGKVQRNGATTWYWPNGRLAQNGATTFYYPNGRLAQNGATTWYWPNGRLAQNGSSTFFTPDGRLTDVVNLVAAGCAARPRACDRRGGGVDTSSPLDLVRVLALAYR